MKDSINKISFEVCDYNDHNHRLKLIELINDYITDPMGGGNSLNDNEANELLLGLSSNPSAFVLFILLNGQIAGMAICFVNFSTFKVKPYINIHDFIIFKQFRGKGLGKKLMEKIIEIAGEKNYCKITLEVRDDNFNAKKLYKGFGFDDSEPIMHFWTKTL